jgi:hypothetical protein
VVCHLHAQRDVAKLWEALEALPHGPILTLPLAFARLTENVEQTQAKGVIHSQDTLVLSYAEALPFAQTHEIRADGVYVVVNQTTPATRRSRARVDLPDDLANWMSTLAARTFVPESEASRLAGAGAGLTDND